MTKRRKHHNLMLAPDEQAMLMDLAGCMGVSALEVLRQLIWVEHHRMAAHLIEHELKPGTQLRLSTSGEFIHRETLKVDRARIVRNIEGALLLDGQADWQLKRLAAMTGRQPGKLVADLIQYAAGPVE